jgi:predicted Abi (CAAX) family protease
MQRWIGNQRLRSLQRLKWVLLGAIAVLLMVVTASRSTSLTTLPSSQYSSTITAPFNQPNYYPAQQSPPSSFYRPTAEWIGRLILPTAEQYQQFAKTNQENDWTWFEIYTAPANAKNLIGQTIRLAWAKKPSIEQYVRIASRDVRFTAQAHRSFQNGSTNPIRLDGRNQVGPLQSLAGGLPHDAVVVQLQGTVILEPGAQTTGSDLDLRVFEKLGDLKLRDLEKTSTALPTILRLEREPLQDVGRFQALVKFIESVPPEASASLPQQCPGEQPCTSDLMRVRHYNPMTRQFDGLEEVIRIPQQPPDWGGVFTMTTRDLVISPAGQAGWYIYGAKANDQRFTVQALRPRSLFQLTPQQTILGFNNGLSYIRTENWQDVENLKGTLQTVLVDATSDTPETAKNSWKVGDRAFVLHLFGGRGGTHDNHESFILGTYAGHFSFGIAEVIQDPFTNEPMLDVDYLQVYGNAPDGTISGAQTWTHYMGNMRRGFMGVRPVSDVLIKLDTLTDDYTFGGTTLSFFNELIGQLSLVMARYRIGDGTGNSTITSATSCVQDSAQAILHTLVRFRHQVESNPEIVQWMQANPTDPTTQRFEKLVELGRDLTQQLIPMGIVRWDWQQNAEILMGVEQEQKFLSIDDFRPKNLATGLISWRTALPRQTHDEFSMLFLNNGASLWFLRPNMIGGNDPGLAPLEATLLFGAWRLPFTQISPLSYLVLRTFGGVTIPSAKDWFITLGILLGFGAIALLFGFSQNFLRWNPWQAPWYRQLAACLRSLIVPALLQEYIFRVLLIPYPKNWIPAGRWWAWALLALGLFVGFQVLYIRFVKRLPLKLWNESRYSIIANPIYISLITILGLACTITYRLTGSLWTITCVHWVFISVWWLLLGGKQFWLEEKQRVSDAGMMES